MKINVTIVDFWVFDMSNLVGRTNSYVDPDGTPPHPPEVNDDERLPRLSGTSVPAADAASRHLEHPRLIKRPLGVSCSTSASNAPPARRRSDKRQKTAEARKDLFCFCSPAALCSSCNCSCAKAGRPCQCSDPGTCGRCTNTIAAHNWTILDENARRTTSIVACFWQRVGRPLDPTIPLYEVPPLPDADNDEFDETVVEQNNPPGNAAETDNDTVVFYDALTGLLALDDFVETNDDDATYSVYPGPSANAGNVDTVSTLTGLPAFEVDIPSASAASLGLPAGRSNSSRNDDVSGVGPDGIDGNAGGPANNCALGDGTVGLAADSGICPPASPGDPNGSVDGSDAPPGISVDVGPAADAHGPTEVVGATDAGSIGTDAAPTQQSARYFPLFYRGNEDRGWRIASAVRGRLRG